MYDRILVATDGSKLSKKAVDSAIKLAALCGAELIALKVLRQREAEHGLRVGAEARQNLDPKVDIAVGLRPHALL